MSRAPERSRFTPLVGLPLVFLTALAAPADAQDLHYTTVTNVEFGGAMGRMMRLMPGMDTEVRESTWISGPRQRTDSESSSSIVDLEARRFTTLDHENRQFWSWSWDDAMAAARTATETMDEGMREARAEAGAARAEAGAEEPARRMEVRLSTDRTGDTREISGFRTERVFVTIEMEAEEMEAPEGAGESEADGAQEREGTMVLLTELWLTDEDLMAVPDELDVEGFREMTEASAEDWAAMEQAFQSDPQLQVAFDRSRAALDDLHGTALESTLFWVLVPPDQEFDREKALADRDRSLSSDLADAAKASAAESAKDAVKSRLGGLFGGKKKEEPPEEPEEPELVQQTFMRIKTLLEEVDRDPIPASKFEVPEGYTERQLPSGGGAR